MITSAAGLLLLQAAAPTPGGSMTGLIFQIAAIIAIFYFIMLRPQQKQRKQREATLSALKRGDEIVTAGGIVGEVIHIREANKEGGATRMDDRVTIKSGESRFIVERGRIERVIAPTTSSAAATTNPQA